MPEINFFSNEKGEKTVTLFRRTMWIVLLLSICILLDLYKVSFFDSHSIVQLWNPLGLLFGPAIYFGVCILNQNRHFNLLKHLSPFFVMATMYIVVDVFTDLHQEGYSGQIVYYHYFYLLTPLSLWFYGFKGIKSLSYIKNGANNRKAELLAVMSIIYIIIGVVYLIIFSFWGVIKIDTGVDYRLLVYSLLFVSCLFNLGYLYGGEDQVSAVVPQITPKSYYNSTLKSDVAKHYQEKILDCFENTEIYLRSDISIDLLAKELGIPKHHFSQIFNIYLKKSFYSFVADYRIAYALNKMELNRGTLTLESLAYECGFNSKTSFNHYFKKNTGFTPNEYQFKF